MARNFKIPEPEVRRMRERVRFEGCSFSVAGGEHYSAGAAFKAIAAYEKRHGLKSSDREPVRVVGGEASNCQPPGEVSLADTREDYRVVESGVQGTD